MVLAVLDNGWIAGAVTYAKCSRPYLILMICMIRYSVKMGQRSGNAGDRNLKRRANVLKLNSVATLTILQTNLHAISVMLTKPIMNSKQKPCAKSMWRRVDYCGMPVLDKQRIDTEFVSNVILQLHRGKAARANCWTPDLQCRSISVYRCSAE